MQQEVKTARLKIAFTRQKKKGIRPNKGKDAKT